MQLWFCLFQHIDHYSRTKAIAEQMVLSANGCSLKGVKLISVCNDSIVAELHDQRGADKDDCTPLVSNGAVCSAAVSLKCSHTLEWVSGSSTFFTLTGAKPLLSSLRVILH